MTRTQSKWAASLAAGWALLFCGTAFGQNENQQERRESDRASQQQNQRDQQRSQRDDQSNRADRRDADEQRSQDRRDRQTGQQEQARQGRQPARQDQRQQQGVMLGVAVDASPTTGVLIRDVLPGSAAERAGLRSGDYILSFDGQRISSPQQFNELLAEQQAGGRADLTIWRNDQEQQLTVELTARQQAGFRGQPPADEQFQGRDQFSQRSARGQQSQAWLGVVLSQQPGDQQRGVRLMQVYPSGPAARAGLRSGDVITRIDQTQVASAEELVDVISRMGPRDQAELTVQRNGTETTLQVTLGDRSDFFGDETFPQDGGQFGGQFDDFDQFAVPEHAMMLEQHRHLARQHQRIEEILLDLRQEVARLRREVQALSGRAPARGAAIRGEDRSGPGLPQPPDQGAEIGRPAPREREVLRPGRGEPANRGTDSPDRNQSSQNRTPDNRDTDTP